MNFVTEPHAIRYVDEQGTVFGEVTFPEVEPGLVAIDHTFVAESLRGQGIAGQLLEHAVTEISRAGLQATPTCSYAMLWFEQNPERAATVATKRS